MIPVLLLLFIILFFYYSLYSTYYSLTIIVLLLLLLLFSLLLLLLLPPCCRRKIHSTTFVTRCLSPRKKQRQVFACSMFGGLTRHFSRGTFCVTALTTSILLKRTFVATSTSMSKSTFHELSGVDIDGNTLDFGKFKNKVVYVTNVASA